MNLVISPKSVVVSSNPVLGKSLARYFRKQFGILLQAVRHTEHLGHAKTDGKASIFTSLKCRLKKSMLRSCKVAWLAKKNEGAKKLFKAGPLAQATFGTEIIGASKELQRSYNSMGLRCAGNLGFNPCTTTSLMLKWDRYQVQKFSCALFPTTFYFGSIPRRKKDWASTELGQSSRPNLGSRGASGNW